MNVSALVDRSRAALLLILCLATAAVIVDQVTESLSLRRDRRVLHIETSGAFDIGDPQNVFGYAPFVVVGEVKSNLGYEKDTTTFSFSVQENLKGLVPSEIVVEQIGIDDGTTIYEMREQPLMTVGETYVLALTAPGGRIESRRLTVMAGSVSGQPVSIDDSQTMRQLRTAAQSRVWPESLIIEGESAHRDYQADWARRHSIEGYAVEGYAAKP